MQLAIYDLQLCSRAVRFLTIQTGVKFMKMLSQAGVIIALLTSTSFALAEAGGGSNVILHCDSPAGHKYSVQYQIKPLNPQHNLVGCQVLDLRADTGAESTTPMDEYAVQNATTAEFQNTGGDGQPDAGEYTVVINKTDSTARLKFRSGSIVSCSRDQ